MRIRVHVTPRQGVLDPQGKAVAGGLRSLGFEETQLVRVGRVIDVTVSGLTVEQALARGEEMAKQLLANAVVEDFDVHVIED
jgi:phosphoribosylformylglycinamidine synthase subunit PurS